MRFKRSYQLFTLSAMAASSLLLGGMASAATPLHGATYSGSFGPPSSFAPTISFKVSANGKVVNKFQVPSPPVGCQGGEFGSASGGSAEVSKAGKFSITLNLIFAQRNSTTGHVVITGMFQTKGTEKGSITSVFTGSSFPKTCNRTESYTTKT